MRKCPVKRVIQGYIESTTGGGRWAGLYGTSREFYLSPHIAAFEAQYWSGIDCSGLVKSAINAARDAAENLVVSIPRGAIGSQQYFGNTTYVYYKSIDLSSVRNVNKPTAAQKLTLYPEEKILKRGDLVRYNGHISIVHDDPDTENDEYWIIHAFGNHTFDHDNDDLTDPIFARKVIVTKYHAQLRLGFGRIKLWD